MALAWTNLNPVAIFFAALAGFAIGSLWYGPMFGVDWMKECGVTEEKAEAVSHAKIYGGGFALCLVASSGLALLIGAGDWLHGALLGLLVGATFVASSLGVIYLFELRTLRLWLIDAGYQVVWFATVGAILGAWH
jgi:hypothetical protein